MDSLEAYTDALCREYDHNGPGLCIGIVKTGELVFSKGYGQAHLGYSTPIHLGTVFHCCSMAKQFTAACVALLEEAGALSLDDRITDYFPHLPAYCNSIRLANLLYMTNGLYDIYDIAGCVCGVSENNAFSERQSWRYIAGTPAPMFLPGERYAYGNTGYFLLGRLVEKVSGQKLSQFARDNIFVPLKMRNTFLRDDKTKIIVNIAMGYKNYSQAHGGAPDDGLCALGDRYSEFADCMEMPGAGQLWTTVNDLAKWDGNFYANQLGSQKQALISRLTTPGQLNSGASCGYGFGLFCHESHGERYVSHGGWAGGYSSNLIRNLDRKISVMALGNHVDILGSISGENGILTKIMDYCLGRRAEAEEAPPSAGRTLPHAERSPYAGKYFDQDTSVIWNISAGPEGSLSVEGYGHSEVLRPDGPDGYRTSSGERLFFAGDCIRRSDQRTMYPFFQGKLSAQRLAEYEGCYQNEALRTFYLVTAVEDGLSVRNQNGLDRLLDLHYVPVLLDIPAKGFCNYPCDTFMAEAETLSCFFITFTRNATGMIDSFIYRDDEGRKREMFVFQRYTAK